MKNTLCTLLAGALLTGSCLKEDNNSSEQAITHTLVHVQQYHGSPYLLEQHLQALILAEESEEYAKNLLEATQFKSINELYDVIYNEIITVDTRQKKLYHYIKEVLPNKGLLYIEELNWGEEYTQELGKIEATSLLNATFYNAFNIAGKTSPLNFQQRLKSSSLVNKLYHDTKHCTFYYGAFRHLAAEGYTIKGVENKKTKDLAIRQPSNLMLDQRRQDAIIENISTLPQGTYFFTLGSGHSLKDNQRKFPHIQLIEVQTY